VFDTELYQRALGLVLLRYLSSSLFLIVGA
jgi:hypothetical protein